MCRYIYIYIQFAMRGASIPNPLEGPLLGTCTASRSNIFTVQSKRDAHAHKERRAMSANNACSPLPLDMCDISSRYLFVQTPTNISSKSLEILFVQYLHINILRTRNAEGFGRSNIQILHDSDSSKSCAFVWGEDVYMRRERLSKSTSALIDVLYTSITCITCITCTTCTTYFTQVSLVSHCFFQIPLLFHICSSHTCSTYSGTLHLDFCSCKSICFVLSVPSANLIFLPIVLPNPLFVCGNSLCKYNYFSIAL